MGRRCIAVFLLGIACSCAYSQKIVPESTFYKSVNNNYIKLLTVYGLYVVENRTAIDADFDKVDIVIGNVKISGIYQSKKNTQNSGGTHLGGTGLGEKPDSRVKNEQTNPRFYEMLFDYFGVTQDDRERIKTELMESYKAQYGNEIIDASPSLDVLLTDTPKEKVLRILQEKGELK